MQDIISKWIRSLNRRIGNKKRTEPTIKRTPFYTLYQFHKGDGTFNYDKYKKIQIDGNKRKAEKVWAIEGNIIFLSRYIKQLLGMPTFGICHGTRTGLEQKWFKEQLGCTMLGTEISDTAERYPDTIQWDFHETKPEWINSVDFIYSNAFDHSYDPQKCLNAWVSCLRPGGLCFLEHSSCHGDSKSTELDPFGADIVVMPYLILTWSKGNFGIRQIIDAPQKDRDIEYLSFIVIQKW